MQSSRKREPPDHPVSGGLARLEATHADLGNSPLRRDQSMRVMTFNIRFQNRQDEKNDWPLRRDLVTHLIEKYDPWILGTQEGMMAQLIYLRDGFTQ